MSKHKSILIACVNYNTTDKLESYIQSLVQAYKHKELNFNLEILIGDNSDEFRPLTLIIKQKGINISHVNNRGNLGFLGGITHAIKKRSIDISNFDYFIVSNVDLEVRQTFFERLTDIHVNEEIGWIAPAIISEKEKRDRNPKIIYRPSLRKMKITILFYRFPLLHFLYERLIYKTRKKQQTSELKNDIIYAGHGSFMIFTHSFSDKNKDFSFPTFLFGEEIFFAELLRKDNLLTIYSPTIIIDDFDHASTGKLKRSDLYKMNYDSIKCLTKKFFLNE
jgi:GT2 family glycosyltransferase